MDVCEQLLFGAPAERNVPVAEYVEPYDFTPLKRRTS